MDLENLRAIERWNVMFSLAAVLAALVAFPSARFVGGVALGAFFSTFNFHASRRFAGWLVRGVAGGERAGQIRVGILAAAWGLKLGLLGVTLWIVVRFVPVSIAGFLLGISVFLLSIAFESVRYARRSQRADSGPANESDAER